MNRHRLLLLPETYAVCRLDKGSTTPDWAGGKHFSSVTRTADELSAVCPARQVPDGINCERGWRCFRIAGTFAFSAIGVIASVVGSLAEAGVSVFVISTFDTDYVLVKEEALDRTRHALGIAGHQIADL